MFKKYQTGKNLVEVLVAIFVVSLGILGIARLQIDGMRQTMESQFRNVATTYAREMIERMRHNPRYAADYNMKVEDKPDEADLCAKSDFCTDSKLPAHDLYEWRSVVQESLPGGLSSVACEKVKTDQLCTVSVYWQVANAKSKDQPTGVLIDNQCTVPSSVENANNYNCVSLPFRINAAG